MHEATVYCAAVTLIEVVGPEIVVDRTVTQHVVGDDQDRLANRHRMWGLDAWLLRRYHALRHWPF